MNTPAHLAASALVWRNEPGWGAASAIALGAVLPDLPMFGFYGYQRLIVGHSESEIWSDLYFRDNWQLCFDIFNSFPLLFLILGVSYVCGFRWGLLLAASALLHLCCDLPLHHDDAHRHFLPFSDWRFVSPISYWDPKYYGFVFIWIELAFALGSCSYVAWYGKHPPMRVVAVTTLAVYLSGIVFIVVMWLPLLANLF